MNNPVPGKPVRNSNTGRPIMALLDLLGRRWALRILWELKGQPLNFRELRQSCDNMSPSVLNQRINELRDAAVLENTDQGYALTQNGRDLMLAMKDLHIWAENWEKRTQTPAEQ